MSGRVWEALQRLGREGPGRPAYGGPVLFFRPVLVPRKPSRYLASRGCTLGVGRQASVLDRPAPLMRGLSAAQCRPQSKVGGLSHEFRVWAQG